MSLILYSYIIFSPYGHRCKNLHDPRVKSSQDESSVVILEHCTKAKKNGGTIPDRLYHHHVASIRQTNPLISPCIWENCRPSSGSSSASSSTSKDWIDTYDLICNAAGPGATSVFPTATKPVQVLSPPRKRRTGSGSEPPPQARYSDIVNKNKCSSTVNPQAKDVLLGEAQKLCIVLQMRTNDSHLDFTYAPVHCEYYLVSMVIAYCFFYIIYAHNKEYSLLISFIHHIYRYERPAMHGTSDTLLPYPGYCKSRAANSIHW